jgi:diguanylate cyclase (GGDEF)-like protein
MDPRHETPTDLVDSIVAMTEQRNIETLESVLAETVFTLLKPQEIVILDLHEDPPQVVTVIRDAAVATPFDLTLEDCSDEIRRRFADYMAAAEQGDELPLPGPAETCGAFPILSRGQSKGVLLVRAEAFTDSDWRLASGLAQIHRNFVHVLNEKDHDRLTGLRNRTMLEEQISRRLTSAQYRSRKSVTEGERRQQAGHVDQNWLAIIDIDHFKSINDTYGHIYGDEVLLLASNLMHKCFRRVDQLYRYGGEEFIVLVQGVDRDTVHRVLERFRRSVEDFEFPQVGRVTVSIGYVEISDQVLPSSVIGHADQALYFAKRSGRNQIAHYETLLQEGKIPTSKTGSIDLF